MPALPIGVSLGTIGVSFDWWRDSALRLEAAGYEGLWSWDHFTTRGSQPNRVLEAAIGGVANVWQVTPLEIIGSEVIPAVANL